jgi:hypothetical protein
MVEVTDGAAWAGDDDVVVLAAPPQPAATTAVEAMRRHLIADQAWLG